MKHEENVKNVLERYKLLALFFKNAVVIELVGFYVICAINVIIVFSYSEFFPEKSTDVQSKRLNNPHFLFKA